MPTAAHENAVSKLHDRPDLLSKLVRKVLHTALDRRLKPIDTTLRFANPEEVRPDIVFLGRHPRWVMVELQNDVDPDKCRRWLLAAAILLNDHGEMGDLLVITASRGVARWAKTVAAARGPLDTALALRPRVLLLAGRTLEDLLDPRHPELAFFAAWAMHHRHGPRAKAIVRRAIDLTGKLPPRLRNKQTRAILNVLNERMMKFVLEVVMDPNKSIESPWFRKFRLEMEANGEARGEARGRAEGEASGRAEGKRDALLVLLSTRELPLSAPQRKQIEACTNLTVLDEWIRRAATAGSAAEVLAPASPSRRRTAAKPAPPTTTRRRANRA